MKQTFILVHDEARRRAVQAVQEAPEGYAVTVGEPTRSNDQNSALWPLLTEISRQLDWPVNGAMVKLQPDEWKAILTAGFRAESVRLAQGIGGGVVMLGERTSTMSKRDFSEFLEYIHWFCAERGVEVRVAA